MGTTGSFGSYDCILVVPKSQRKPPWKDQPFGLNLQVFTNIVKSRWFFDYFSLPASPRMQMTPEEVTTCRKVVIVNGNQSLSTVLQGIQIANVSPRLVVIRDARVEVLKASPPLILFADIKITGLQAQVGHFFTYFCALCRRLVISHNPTQSNVQVAVLLKILNQIEQHVRPVDRCKYYVITLHLGARIFPLSLPLFGSHHSLQGQRNGLALASLSPRLTIRYPHLSAMKASPGE